MVLLEDIRVQIGLFFSLASVRLAHFSGERRWNAAGSSAIGALLVVIAIVLAIEMKSLLIGEAARERDLDRIVAALEGGSGVRRLIHLRTQHLGPDELLVGAKLEFESSLSSRMSTPRLPLPDRRPDPSRSAPGQSEPWLHRIQTPIAMKPIPAAHWSRRGLTCCETQPPASTPIAEVSTSADAEAAKTVSFGLPARAE